MRVISQSGAADVPYETGSLNMICADLAEPKRTIIYYYHSCFGTAIKLAEYSAETKAVKAMEMCREVYRLYDADHVIFRFPQDDEIEV